MATLPTAGIAGDSVTGEIDNGFSKIKLSKSLSSPARRGGSGNRSIPVNRTLSRAQSIKEHVTKETGKFFGISNDPEPTQQQQWTNRRIRHCSRLYGAVKDIPGVVRDVETPEARQLPYDPLSRGRTIGVATSVISDGAGASVIRSMSLESRGSRRSQLPSTLLRRDSVAKMAWDGLSTLVRTGTSRSRRPTSRNYQGGSQMRSFAAESCVGEDSVFDTETYLSSNERLSNFDAATVPVTPVTPAAQSMAPIQEISADVEEREEVDMKPIVLPLGGRPPQSLPMYSTATLEGFAVPICGEAAPVRTKALRRQIAAAAAETPTPLTDDVFFDQSGEFGARNQGYATTASAQDHDFVAETPKKRSAFTFPVVSAQTSQAPSVRPVSLQLELSVQPDGSSGVQAVRYRPYRTSEALEIDEQRHVAPGIPILGLQRSIGDGRREVIRVDEPPRPSYVPGFRRRAKRRKEPESPLTIRNVWSRMLSRALSTSGKPKRRFGEGVIGRFFGRALRSHSELEPHVIAQLDSFEDFRPFFTYWVTIVQILVTIIALGSYGFGPVGFQQTQRTAMVRQSFLVLEQVAYGEQENFWIGPRYADLVHLGAKFTPCMRRDRKIWREIEANKALENETACCIANDRSFCVQTTRDRCTSYATWHKWGVANISNPDSRSVGTVCGQDPRDCQSPASTPPFEWPNDLTQWPVCLESSKHSSLPHMQCELSGRPCCIGIHGECRITTREYCDFVKGYFHQEALLCSQVSCLEEVCGMIPFVNKDHPDQFYRLFTNMFLHAGILHCLCTVVIHVFLMRDLEKLIGWFRLSVIYLVSGIGGTLASAIFVPYQAEVGPAGSQFGLLAALLVDAIYSWKMIVHPWKAVLQLGGVLLFLFTIGLLPWIDNWAHFFGFVFGLLLSLALFPYIQFGNEDRVRRVVIVSTSLVLVIGLFVGLILAFYHLDDWSCPICVYFNCLPFAENFCDNKGMDLKLQPI